MMGRWDHLTPKDVPTVEVDWEDITDFEEWNDTHPDMVMDSFVSWAKLLEWTDKECVLGRNYCYTATSDNWSELRFMPPMLPNIRVVEAPENGEGESWSSMKRRLGYLMLQTFNGDTPENDS